MIGGRYTILSLNKIIERKPSRISYFVEEMLTWGKDRGETPVLHLTRFARQYIPAVKI